MNTTIMLLGMLVPMLAASMFYLSDHRAARRTTTRDSPSDDQQE